MTSHRILVIDDEPGIRQALGQLLEYEGYDVRSAASGPLGIAEYEKFRPHLVFLDVKMAGIDGLEVLKRLRQIDGGATVVMISGHATIQTAVEATQLGAFDILEKPLDTDRVLVLLRNALQQRTLSEENQRLRQTIDSRYEIVGRSYPIRALLERIEKVASTPDDYSRGIIVGLTALLDSLGLSTRDVGEVLHGCTVATNTILEGRGARTGLITTRGFRDVLELRRIRVPRLYDPLYVKPEPLAPREVQFLRRNRSADNILNKPGRIGV